MSKFISKRLASLDSYTPGEQPTIKKDSGIPSIIKLNTNESPYPPSPGVIKALSEDEISMLNLYPNPDGAALIEKLASHYGVLPENIILGNGSDELLAFTFLAFFEGGVIFPDITYGFYPVYAGLYNIPYTQIPLKTDLTVNVDDYVSAEKNIILANPNAPTGIALSLSDIEKIAGSNPDRLTVIDEAYVDFGADSAVSLINKFENLLVIHTYSKARSMAGARLAYAIAPKPVADDLKKIKYSFNPYNVDRLAQAAGLAALHDDDYYVQNQREIISTRSYTAEALRSLGFEMTDSKANFLFVKNSRISGEDLYKKLKAVNILVRHWKLPRISDYVRITIGTKEQMDALLSAISSIPGGQE